MNQIADRAIKEMIQKGQSPSFYISSMILCWDIDNFESKQDAKNYYMNLVIAIRIKCYCRSHKVTTRRGTYFSTDKGEHPKLWNIVTQGFMDGKSGAMVWQWRKVDQLRNIRIWF